MSIPKDQKPDRSIYECEDDGIRLKNDGEILEHAKMCHRIIRKEVYVERVITTEAKP